MNVSLGTLEVSDEERLLIKKAINRRGRGMATREEVRDWAFNLILEDLEERKYIKALPKRRPRR